MAVNSALNELNFQFWAAIAAPKGESTLSTSLRLTLFGGFQARDSAGGKIALEGTKASLLLAYLACDRARFIHEKS